MIPDFQGWNQPIKQLILITAGSLIATTGCQTTKPMPGFGWLSSKSAASANDNDPGGDYPPPSAAQVPVPVRPESTIGRPAAQLAGAAANPGAAPAAAAYPNTGVAGVAENANVRPIGNVTIPPTNPSIVANPPTATRPTSPAPNSFPAETAGGPLTDQNTAGGQYAQQGYYTVPPAAGQMPTPPSNGQVAGGVAAGPPPASDSMATNPTSPPAAAIAIEDSRASAFPGSAEAAPMASAIPSYPAAPTDNQQATYQTPVPPAATPPAELQPPPSPARDATPATDLSPDPGSSAYEKTANADGPWRPGSTSRLR